MEVKARGKKPGLAENFRPVPLHKKEVEREDRVGRIVTARVGS